MTTVQLEYNYPLFKQTPMGLFCGCDMCFSTQTLEPHQSIGPHDLHCVCPNCMTFCLNEDAYDEALSIRYPGYESFKPESLTQEQIDQLWSEVDNYYTDPDMSPTNQEMHAMNGNILVHDEGNQQAIDRQLAEAKLKLKEGLYPGHKHRGFHKGKFDTHFDFGPFNKLYDTIMPSHDIPEPSPQEIEDYSIQLDPFMQQRLQAKKGPTNKDMHSYNGNKFTIIPGEKSRMPIPKLDPRKAPGARSGLQEADPSIRVRDPALPPFEQLKPKERRKFQEVHPEISKAPKGDLMYPHYDPWGEIYFTNSPDDPNTQYPDAPLSKQSKQQEVSSGPTNKEMHATNGNIKRFGPITEKQHLRKQRKKLKRKLKRKSQVVVNVNAKPTIRKNNNKASKAATKIEKKELQVARKYATFLKQPCFMPPRLGSTGSAPTKILQGWFKQTFSMALPAVGTGGSNTNCTEVIAFISPKMFKVYTGPTDFASPITIGFANASSVTFDAANANNTLYCTDFANLTALQNEAGNPSTTQAAPLARWLGGSISLECRCPMASTAPPYAFGGLLPTDGTTSTGLVNTATQLNRLTTTGIRNLKCVVEEQGFQVSTVYVPSSPNDLLFSPYIAQSSGQTVIPPSPIPFVGMSGCPTTATVTLLVNGWFEIQQTQYNMNYASGWALGPKVSSEDVFDNLPRIKPVTTKLINLGAKSGPATVASALEAMAKKPEPIDIHQQLNNLMYQVKNLKLLIDDEEDEKYVTADSAPTTPIHRGLTQSTIDLALALKDRITPGSVTSKTTRTPQI